MFAEVGQGHCDRLSRVAADLTLAPGEYAAHAGDPPALFGVLEGRIEVVRVVDGVESVIGERRPGDVIGELSITLGMPQPGGYRAAEASRLFRIQPHDYRSFTAVEPEVGRRVDRLASHRMGGSRGLRARMAETAPPRGDRPRPPVGRRLCRAEAVPRPQPDPVRVAAAGRPRRRGAVGGCAAGRG